MKIGYMRVSKREQNLERQIDSLKEYGCDRVFVDRLSGKNRNRPEFNKMLDMLRPGDVVIVKELSRLGRSISDTIAITSELQEKKVDLFVINTQWLNTSTPEGKYFYYSMALLEELRREMIVQSTNEGLAAARARGRVGGRPPVDQDKLKAAIVMYESKQHTIKEITRITGISQGTLYKYKDKKVVTE